MRGLMMVLITYMVNKGWFMATSAQYKSNMNIPSIESAESLQIEKEHPILDSLGELIQPQTFVEQQLCNEATHGV